MLGDIELAQGLEREREKKQKVSTHSLTFPVHDVIMTSLQTAAGMSHPLDINYENLKAKLVHIKKEEEEYKVVHKYIEATGHGGWRKVQLMDLFRVDREGEVGCVEIYK